MVRRSLIVIAALVFSAPALSGEAEDLLMAGRVAEALPVARTEAETAPGDIPAQELYIDALLTMGLIGVADRAYRERVEAIPTAESWYLFGRVLMNPTESERAYQLSLQQNPEFARSHMGLGSVYLATGNLPEAVTAYQQALSLDTSLAEAWSGLIQVHVSAQNFQAAQDAANSALRAIPDDADAYLMHAQLIPESALETLRTGARRAPKDPRIHAALAEAWLDRGNGSEARVSAKRALAISPSFSDPALSVMFANEMIRGVLDADGYHELLSTRIVENDDAFAAIAAYNALIIRYPQSALPLMSRARMRARQGNTAGAIHDLANAIGNDSENDEALAALGLLLLEDGRLDEARSVLGQVVQLRPGDTALTLALARAQDASGDKAAALQTASEIHALRPLHVEAALITAKFMAESGDSEGAYEVLITVAREVPDERLVLALAAASKDIGRTQDAARWLDRMAMSSGNPAYSELAAALRGSGSP